MLLTLLLSTILLAVTAPSSAQQMESVPHSMTELDRINLEHNLRWMLDRERQQPKRNATVRVGVYADAGVWHIGAKSLVELLEAEWIACRLLDRTQLDQEHLKDIYTLVIPGGWAPLQWGGAGEAGLQAIKQFVERGGRCVGICAGAYLLSKNVKYDEQDYPYPLGLYDGTATGPVPKLERFPKPGSVKLTVTEAGKKMGFEELNNRFIYYSGGPCFEGGTGIVVLAQYPNGSAAIINRPVAQGEIIRIGRHIERPVLPLGDDAPAPKELSSVLRKIIQPR